MPFILDPHWRTDEAPEVTSFPRDRVSIEGPTYDYYLHYKEGNVIRGPDAFVSHQVERRCLDYNTPEYWSLVGRGRIINKPCEIIIETTKSLGVGSYSAIYLPTGNVMYTATGPITQGFAKYGFFTDGYQVLPAEPDLTDMIDLAKFKAIKFMDKTPHVFGEDVAELHKTLRFLRNPIGSLLNVSKAFRKSRLGHMKAGLTRAQALSQTWLEFRFALTPLLISIEGAMMLYGSRSPLPARRTARGIVKSKAGFDEFRAGNQFATQFLDVQVSEEVSTEVRATILYSVSNPIDTGRELAGLRLKNVPETVWAIVPYSFMIDRVVNITGAIQGYLNLSDPGLDVLSGCVVTKTSSKRTDQVLGQPHNAYDVTLTGNVAERKSFKYQRTPWVPTWSETMPPLEKGGLIKDLTKTIDLLTLCIVRLR
jgi:hypothetical protein